MEVSNGLDPDQDRRSVLPDLDPNCLQKRYLSTDDKIMRVIFGLYIFSSSLLHV